MNRVFGAVVLGVLAYGLGGCATVVNGTSQNLDFRTDPAGSQAMLVNGISCDTPCSIKLKRGKDTSVTFTKPGYKAETVYIQSRLGGSAFGNILAGGIIGGVVDGANGASNRLYPNPASIRLVPEGSSEQAVLLDKKEKVISTVAEHNAKVAADVKKGLEKQGIPAANLAGQSQ